MARSAFAECVVSLWPTLDGPACHATVCSLSDSLKKQPQSADLRNLIFRIDATDHPNLNLLSADGMAPTSLFVDL